MRITVGKTLKYTLLPGIVPRLREFFSSGFALIALFMAGAFQAARLIPANHPYLNQANIGRYGIRQVLAEARKNLVFRRENTDQVILYYTVLLGMFLMLLQGILLLLSLSTHSAEASDTASWWGKFFANANPQGDIAFMMLDSVFGFKGVYGSCIDPSITCPSLLASVPVQPQWPSAFHNALHQFFNFYNIGIAAVGLVIFLYMVAAVVAETAQSGIPFGRRYNPWTPVRLMLAIGLLAPLSNGMNTAQMTTLYVAKWGSNLASNGWIIFNQSLTSAGSTPIGMPDNLVVDPTAPESNNFLEFMLVAKTCKYAEKAINQRDIEAYQVYRNPDPGGDSEWDMPDNYTDALDNSGNHDVYIVFGEKNDMYNDDIGNVKPVCGEMVMTASDVNSPGALAVEKDYYKMIVDGWGTDTDFGSQTDTFGKQIFQRFTPNPDKDPSAPIPDADYINDSNAWFLQQTSQAVQDGRTAEQEDKRWVDSYTQLGWGGAAMWYNKIAEYNGSLVSSTFNLPQTKLYPDVMEYVKSYHLKHNSGISGPQQYNPDAATDPAIDFRKQGEDKIAAALYNAQTFWLNQPAAKSKGGIGDVIDFFFGTSGLYSMVNNADVHPLAQLVGIGRSMIERCVRNLGLAAGAGVAGGLMKLSDSATLSAMGDDAVGFADIIWKVAKINLMIGFTLYYVLPFLPFIYFFFALGNWVKAIFEAMVGVPLWALAHIRMDGQGIPGPLAMNGYYLILEIFLRPIIIIFGLIISVSIFAAQVKVMNQIWNLVVTNLTGANATAAAAVTAGQPGAVDSMRDSIDGFFYTIIYAVITYMLGMASFKMIDLIPANIMRWIGASIQPFGAGEDAGAEFMGATQSLEQGVLSAANTPGSLANILGRSS